MRRVVVYKGRTNIVTVGLGVDVSDDTFTSEIRAEKDRSSDLIAAWTVSFSTDGKDGELELTLDESITSTIIPSVGYMDIKRNSGGEPLPVFDEPLEVIFQETITV